MINCSRKAFDAGSVSSRVIGTEILTQIFDGAPGGPLRRLLEAKPRRSQLQQ